MIDVRTLSTAAMACAVAASAGGASAGEAGLLKRLPTLEAAVGAARSDAAKRLAAAGTKASIDVESAEPVAWSDGSLGCPRPGLRYTHALVNGYRVKLRVGQATWDYHATVRGALLLCPEDRARDALPRKTD